MIQVTKHDLYDFFRVKPLLKLQVCVSDTPSRLLKWLRERTPLFHVSQQSQIFVIQLVSRFFQLYFLSIHRTTMSHIRHMEGIKTAKVTKEPQAAAFLAESDT